MTADVYQIIISSDGRNWNALITRNGWKVEDLWTFTEWGARRRAARAVKRRIRRG